MAESTLSIPEAATRLNEVVDRARRLNESTLLTDNGEPVARVVPVTAPGHTAGELANWWATREKLDPEDVEQFAADIEEARRIRNRPLASKWD